MGNINSRSSSMTSFISIFSILMVILANHPTNSGAVPKSNKLQQQDALTELTERMQRSLAEPEQSHMKPAKRGKKLAKKQRSGKKGKKSAKKQEGKSKRRGGKSSKRAKTKPVKRMNGKETKPSKRMKEKQSSFEFRSCDYLDLVEVGQRPNSDFDCGIGDKFLFKAVKGLRRQ